MHISDAHVWLGVPLEDPFSLYVVLLRALLLLQGLPMPRGYLRAKQGAQPDVDRPQRAQQGLQALWGFR